MTPREAIERIGGVWRNGHGIGPCPVPGHGKGRGDLNWSLSISAGTKQSLVAHCFAGCNPVDVLAALRDTPAQSAAIVSYDAKRFNGHVASARIHAIALWEKAMPIIGTLGETYLASRRIAISSRALRFLADAWHAPTARRSPAMLASLADAQGNIVAVQRTFLTTRGRKADVEPVRMMLGSLTAGAVQLTQAGETLGLAEGVESALAASQIHNIPCWAACGARLHRIALPDIVRHVVLYADNDPPGLETAYRAMRRFRAEGREVDLRAPEEVGSDWNDILLTRANT